MYQTRFANPQSISDYHQSALILLLDFHYSNKGRLPFAMAEHSDNLQDLASIGELNEDQVLFIKNTAILVRQRREYILCLSPMEFTNSYFYRPDDDGSPRERRFWQ